MKSLKDYIIEQQSDATSKNIMFDFTGLDNAEDTINSLQELSKKSGVPVSVDGTKVTISFTKTTLKAADSIIDVLQQYIEIEGKSQKRASNEQYAQRLHKFEDAMKSLDEFRDLCAEIDTDTDAEQDPKENEPGAADGGELRESKEEVCPKCGKKKCKNCKCKDGECEKDENGCCKDCKDCEDCGECKA